MSQDFEASYRSMRDDRDKWMEKACQAIAALEEIERSGRCGVERGHAILAPFVEKIQVTLKGLDNIGRGL